MYQEISILITAVASYPNALHKKQLGNNKQRFLHSHQQDLFAGEPILQGNLFGRKAKVEIYIGRNLVADVNGQNGRFQEGEAHKEGEERNLHGNVE